jgi:hypothetical protein
MVANILQAPTTQVLQQFAIHLRAYRTYAYGELAANLKNLGFDYGFVLFTL